VIARRVRSPKLNLNRRDDLEQAAGGEGIGQSSWVSEPESVYAGYGKSDSRPEGGGGRRSRR
jgi:hypothetical protein